MISIYRRLVMTLLGGVLLACAAPQAAAETILLFSRQPGSFESSLPTSDLATYGDRVTSPIQGPNSFKYGGAANTPNIVVGYGADESTWWSNYGDLEHVIYTRGVSFGGDDILRVILTADPGYQVRLNSFDLAGWSQTDHITKSVRVFNSTNQLVFDQSNVLVQGDAIGPRRTSFLFSSLESQSLRIEIDASNITPTFEAQNIGIDNISFSQVTAIPEPSSIGLGLLAVFSLVCLRRCRKPANVL